MKGMIQPSEDGGLSMKGKSTEESINKESDERTCGRAARLSPSCESVAFYIATAPLYRHRRLDLTPHINLRKEPSFHVPKSTTATPLSPRFSSTCIS